MEGAAPGGAAGATTPFCVGEFGAFSPPEPAFPAPAGEFVTEFPLLLGCLGLGARPAILVMSAPGIPALVEEGFPLAGAASVGGRGAFFRPSEEVGWLRVRV